MTDSVVVEGYARLREGKKWRTRWLVFRKPSPVADCLVLLVFKDKSDKVQGSKERACVTLEEICGLEPGQCYEGVAFTLAVLCLNQAALLGFDSREALQAWDARLRYSLGEVHRFSVGVLPGTKLKVGPATLHLCNNLLALARDTPPTVVAHWNLPDLRRYGPVPNGFVFEGGTRCGYWAGVFLLASAESEQISFLFDCIVRGISPTRGPFGLQPVLPDLGSSQTSLEDKLNLEAEELEKRLSMLSQGSSTVSTTYFPSGAGDDRSISGSSDTSDTSQSDCSVGSRLTIWNEPVSSPLGNTTHMGAKVLLQIVEKPASMPGGGSRPSLKPPRQLHEIGRQSSSDSGIATGSHSSYSGSFSSYASSMDTPPGEDFGSVFSLPPHLAQELSPCTCTGTVPGNGYQVPTSLRYLYDTPRSLSHDAGDSETLTRAGSTEGTPRQTSTSEDTDQQRAALCSDEPADHGGKAKAAPSGDPCRTCSSVSPVTKTIVTICSACGGLKKNPCFHSNSFVTPILPVKNMQKSCASGELLSVKPGDEWMLPRRGEKNAASALSDGFSFPSAGRRPCSLSLYESMSPASLKEPGLALVAPSRDKRAVIYENCLKCRGARCQPPPRGAPVKASHSRDTGPHLKRSQENDVGAEDGAEQCQSEGVNDSAESADKKLNSKEEKHRVEPAYEVMESRVPEKHLEAEERSRYELMGSYSQQNLLPEPEGSVFVFPPEASLVERPRCEGATYVNIPVPPTSKKQLNYMELELQELALGSRGPPVHLPSQRKCSTKYAQIDITATETAHKVGTQHALGRQEGLHTLELRRKGAPH